MVMPTTPRWWWPAFDRDRWPALYGDGASAFCRRLAIYKATAVQGLGGLLFPADCMLCQKMLARPFEGPLCPDCVSHLAWIEGPFCERCGLPYAPSVRPGRCGPCRRPERRFRKARAGLVYDADVRRLLHALKFGQCERIASILGRRVAERWLRPGELGRYDAIVPVPLSKKRRRERGFNQAERIARAVAKSAGAPVCSRVIRKVGERPPQAGLSRAARRLNARSAYRARVPAPLEGADVLLVDDVFTTGATVDAASRALLVAGVGSVDVLTLARVP